MNETEAVFSPGAEKEMLHGGKSLTFTLADGSYGISIHKIREIIGMMPVTRIPQAYEHVKGVINLRGNVIPVVDLRLRFGMNEIEHTDRTCIVIVEVVTGQGTRKTGLIVDSVSEVLNIRDEDVVAPPDLGTGEHVRYIHGMANMADGVKILIDVDQALGEEVSGMGQGGMPA